MTKKTAAQLTEKQIVHRIRVKARAGRNRRQIAAELGITYDRVHRLAAKHGIAFSDARRRAQAVTSITPGIILCPVEAWAGGI